MSGMRRRTLRGFSLIELVIVVVIIAIIGAIAIPRMSRGAAGASDSALIADLTTLRNAIDLYATEHGGKYPKAADIVGALTSFTDESGTISPTGAATTTYTYGPYLRAVPPLPVGPSGKKGATGIAAAPGDNIGWVYTDTSGKIIAGTTGEDDKDAKGVKYNTY